MMLRRLLEFARMFQESYTYLEEGIENLPEKERQAYNHLNSRASINSVYNKRELVQSVGISRKRM